MVNKPIDVSIASNRNSGKTDINILENDKRIRTKTTRIMKMMLNDRIMQ